MLYPAGVSEADTGTRSNTPRRTRRTQPSRQHERGSQGGWISRALALTLAGMMVVLAGCERVDSVQTGYRGTAMIQYYRPSRNAEQIELNRIPPPEPSDPYDPAMPMATEVNQNVQVLTDLNALEFARLMQAISTWVAPEEGCAYCHNTENLASDEKYTKRVSRSMLLMTRAINTNWKSHVAETGVTCWTCHRGKNVPSDIWFRAPKPRTPSAGTSGSKAGQNMAGVAVNGNSSLPFDPLTPFLEQDNQIGIQGTTVLPTGNRRSIKQGEWAYSLMMYMSKSLGVNCTYCHHTRAMGVWDQSTPQRVTAWHGIRMVREINGEYLNPLKPEYPEARLGPTGDAPKAACGTCHKGAYKPLFGVSMLGDYPSMAGVLPGRLKPAEAPAELEPASAESESAAPESAAAPAEQVLAAVAVPATAEDAGTPAAATEDGAETPEDAGTEAVEEAAQVAAAEAEPSADAEAAETAEPQPLVSAVTEEPADAEAETVADASQEAEAEEVETPAGEEQAAEMATEPAPEQVDAEEAAPAEAGPDGAAPEAAQAEIPAPAEVAPSTSDRVAELEQMVADLHAQLAEAAAAREAMQQQLSAPPGTTPPAQPLATQMPLIGAGAEPTVSQLRTEIDRLRLALGASSPQLRVTQQFALALDAAEQRLAAMEARFVHERATLEERLALAMSERDTARTHADQLRAQLENKHRAALAAAEARIAELEAQLARALGAPRDGSEGGSMAPDQSDTGAPQDADPGASSGDAAREVRTLAHAAALEDAEQTIGALSARLEQERTALAQQLEVVRAQRDNVAADVKAELTDAHEAALEDADETIQALAARLEQERTALQQQLEVVREQRDTAASEAAKEISDAYEDELLQAEQGIQALSARLDQERTALQQQLEVVRAQRDGIAEQVEERLSDDHADALEDAETLIGALSARLDQERTALQQQLEVVREQRDRIAQQVAARLQDAHAAAVEQAEASARALAARLDQQTTALEQQLAVVRGQRDSLAAELGADAAQFLVGSGGESEAQARMVRLEQEAAALEQQLAVVRAQRDQIADEVEQRLGDAHEEELAAMQQHARALKARLEQQTTALEQQLAVVRAQREQVAEEVAQRLEKAQQQELAAIEQEAAALAARLDQQVLALEQQLLVVRAQRDAALAEVEERIPLDVHEEALAEAQARLRAERARLDNQVTALEQQLLVVRAQRDAALGDAESRLQALAEQHASERDTLAQELAAIRTQVETLEQEKAAAVAALEERLEGANETASDLRARLEDASEELAVAEEAAAEPEPPSLSESAADLGGEVTEEGGVVVSLGGEQLQFASGSAVVPEGMLPTLDRAAEILKARAGVTGRIEGHTDSSGSDAINQALSQQRAEAVMQALVERGVPADRLTAEGKGEAEPIATNATAAGRRENRRVEIYLAEVEAGQGGSVND